MQTQSNHQTQAARFFVQAFGVVILMISATTTFGFFYNYFPSILPPGVAGEFIGALIAGAMGVTLFDLATVYWLNTFLKDAETTSQRAIALLMVVVTFAGAAAASIAHLGLTAGGDITLQGDIRGTIGYIAIVTVIVGVVANFGANIAYTRFSLENQQRVREANRRDVLQAAEDDQAALLDGLISQKVSEKISGAADALAQHQAERLVQAFLNKEQSKYANVTGKALASPTPSTDTQPVKVQRVNPDDTRENLPDKVMPIAYATNGNGTNGRSIDSDFLANGGA